MNRVRIQVWIRERRTVSLKMIKLRIDYNILFHNYGARI